MLTEEQSAAIEKIRVWLADNRENFFMLRGSAGTGKTFCIRELVKSVGGNYAYTAPTNKATKVLKDSVTTEDYMPLCRTIYALLGLTMDNDGEIKQLRVPKDPVNLSQFTAIVVDEASMTSAQLFRQIELAAIRYNIKFIFMGDPAQLPPVGEKSSKVWEIGAQAVLTKVMRHDNQILALATRLREQVDVAEPHITLTADNNETEGVWKMPKVEFEALITWHANEGLFTIPNTSKVIAWRNKRVNTFNQMIRSVISPSAPDWTPGDRILFASAMRDQDKRMLAAIDDEGTVTQTEIDTIDGFKTWLLEVQLDDNSIVVANPLHEDSRLAYEDRLRVFADEARNKERKWADYWDLKEKFQDMRYAYAITAHRAQGSTYETAFVCWQDILRNQDRQEAFRCLYVASTRPKTKLIFS